MAAQRIPRTRETAGTLTNLWQTRVDGAPIDDIVARLNTARDSTHSGRSRDTLDQLLDILGNPRTAGSFTEAVMWATLIYGWSFGHPPVPLVSTLTTCYPLGTAPPTRFCEHCGTSGLAPGDGRTECGFCR